MRPHGKSKKAKCRAQARSTKKPCQLVAGYGTDHLGQGRCKFHGGCAPIKHGRYSKVLRKNLREAYERQKKDPQTSNLTSEVALLRAILENWLGKWQDTTDLDSLKTTREIIESIGKLVEKFHKIEVGEKYTIDLRGIEHVINRVVEVVNRHIKDPAVKNRIAKDLASLNL